MGLASLKLPVQQNQDIFSLVLAVRLSVKRALLVAQEHISRCHVPERLTRPVAPSLSVVWEPSFSFKPKPLQAIVSVETALCVGPTPS